MQRLKYPLQMQRIFHVTQGDKKIFEEQHQGTDYVQKSKKESEIKKDY